MKDLNKLHFTESDERDLRILCDELDRLQKQCKDTLWKDMVSVQSVGSSTLTFALQNSDCLKRARVWVIPAINCQLI